MVQCYSSKRKRRIRYDRILFLILTFIVSFLMIYHIVVAAFNHIFISEIGRNTNLQAQTVVQEKTSFAVMLDPGHGGFDDGTSVNKIKEKDITLQLVKRIGYKLEQKGIDVIYTRETDQALGDNEKEDLKARKRRVEYSNVNLFLSIHVNFYETDDINGYEIYIDNSNSYTNQLALHLDTSLQALNLTPSRGIRNGNNVYFLTSDMAVPSLLLEIGYLSNEQDRQWMTQESSLNQEADAIVHSILSYKNDE